MHDKFTIIALLTAARRLEYSRNHCDSEDSTYLPVEGDDVELRHVLTSMFGFSTDESNSIISESSLFEKTD